MRKRIQSFVVFFVIMSLPAMTMVVDCTDTYGYSAIKFSLATGSLGELGLLKILADAFNDKNKTNLCWGKAGSGK